MKDSTHRKQLENQLGWHEAALETAKRQVEELEGVVLSLKTQLENCDKNDPSTETKDGSDGLRRRTY